MNDGNLYYYKNPLILLPGLNISRYIFSIYSEYMYNDIYSTFSQDII